MHEKWKMKNKNWRRKGKKIIVSVIWKREMMFDEGDMWERRNAERKQNKDVKGFLDILSTESMAHAQSMSRCKLTMKKYV